MGVPGTLKLLETTHRRFGRLPWASLIFPTIDLAETGFAISPRLADSIVAHHNETRQLAKFETTRRYFFNGDGSPKKAGALLKNPEFADTLRLIAAGGADVFYHGEIAADIIRTVNADKDNPGIMGESDFAHYEVIERPPVCMRYRRHRVLRHGAADFRRAGRRTNPGDFTKHSGVRGMKDDADAAQSVRRSVALGLRRPGGLCGGFRFCPRPRSTGMLNSRLSEIARRAHPYGQDNGRGGRRPAATDGHAALLRRRPPAAAGGRAISSSSTATAMSPQ